MINDFSTSFLKSISAFSKQFPGLSRYARQMAILSNALRPYRTAANDHLRRGLRLSWINAATALFHDRLEWANAYPTAPGAQDLRNFEAMFNAISKEILAKVCNLESGKSIGESPIDVHLDLLVAEMPAHLRGDEMAPDVAQQFGPTLAAITSISPSEVPSALKRAALDGIAPNSAKTRHFGQLFADEFARILQDPNYYPEAAGSFEVIQAEAQRSLLRELKTEVAGMASNLPTDVASEVKATLDSLSDDWLGADLKQQLNDLQSGIEGLGQQGWRIEAGVDQIHSRLDEMVAGQGPARRKVRVEDVHIPTQTRTVMLAGTQTSGSVMNRYFDDAADKISRRAARISEKAAVVPLKWDFSLSITEEGFQSPYAETGAWETLNENVIGAVLLLGDALSDGLVPDESFLVDLSDRDWLVPKGVFDDTHALRGRGKLDFINDGGVPLTYETRFALECLLRSVPLTVLVTSPDAAARPPLSNFIAFLYANETPIVQLDDIRRNEPWAEAFVSSLPGVHSSVLRNPYRALDFYQTDDADAFFGRDREAALAATDIDLALKDGTPLLMAITGPSGCGKSSFLRARVAAEARKAHDLIPLEMRPTDFQCNSEIGVQCLPILMSKLAALSSLEIPSNFTGPNAPYHALLLPQLKRLIDDGVDNGSLSKMLICIDQFEEILDDLSEEVNAMEWRSMIAVLHHLNQQHGWPVVFTLEDSRKDRFERHRGDLGFMDATIVELRDDDDSFYRKIIVKPFERNGIDLDHEIVDELLGEVKDLQAQNISSSSPLPLLALKLSRFFHELAPRAPKQVQDTRLSQSFNRLPVTRADIAGTSLALGDMVADLAATAWNNGGGDDDPDSIKYFLRPMVRISIDLDHPGEGKMVLKPVQGRGYHAEQALHDAFKELRLLVPSAGGYRLVHEAVIRRWPRAREWFEADQDDLEAEAQFRSKALGWTSGGCEDLPPPTEDEITIAARILSSHLRDWSMTDLAVLGDEERALMNYAICNFKTSKTPAKSILEDEPSGTYMHLAASYGLDDLIADFIKIDSQAVHLKHGKTKKTPLGQASWGQLSTTQLLLEHGSRVDALEQDNFTPLDGAVWGEKPDILSILLAKADPQKWPKLAQNPLGGAARRGRLDIEKMLTDAGFRHDQNLKGGFTPLHQAALQPDLSVFKHFMERGDLSVRDANGDTALHVAARFGSLPIIEHILTTKEGSQLLSGKQSNWGTPLMCAALLYKTDIVKYLMSLTTDINVRAEAAHCKGFTVLHMALYSYHDDKEFILTDQARQHMFATIKQLLTDKNLDVGARTEKPELVTADAENEGAGLTAWEMASALPEIQQEIAKHPRFPEERLKELRAAERGKQAIRIKEQLFEAAKSKAKRKFVATLQQADTAVDLDARHEVNNEHFSVAAMALRNGWKDLIYAMIEAKQIDPWAITKNHPGLYNEAVKLGESDMAQYLEASMPAELPAQAATPILINLSDPASKLDPDERKRIRTSVLAHIPPETATESLQVFARLGDEKTMNDLLDRGGGADWQDDWGRTVFETAPDAIRSARGLPDLGVAGPVGGDSLFYPDAEGWTALSDPSLVEDIDKSDEMAWDEDVVWSERRLPFYPDEASRLLRAKHPDWPAATYLYYLSHEDALYWLDGTSPPIHLFNAQYTCDFEGDKALDYLKFFCFFVRGEEGPFYVLDGRDAHYLPDGLERQELEKINECYQMPRQWGEDENGNRRISTLVYYSNAVFVGDFLIQPSGMIDMTDDWPVVSDLTQQIDAPVR